MGTGSCITWPGDIWLLDGPDAPGPQQLDVSLGSPAAARAPRLVTAADHLGDLDCDRTGQASVVEVRGTVHWLTHKDGPARALHVDPGARARLPRVLGETGKVAWVTDAAGPDALEVRAVAGEPRSVRLAEGLLGTVTSLAASPDGATVAAAAHDGRLLVVDVDPRLRAGHRAGRVRRRGHRRGCPGRRTRPGWPGPSPGPGRCRGSAWPGSPTREVVEVTDGRFADTDPVFTADGLYLAFLSVRSFDPVYDAQSFDLSFPFGSRPYLVPLAAHTPSPFGPVPGGRPVSQDPPDRDKNDSSERIVVSVDADGLAGSRGGRARPRGPVLGPGSGQGRPGLAPRAGPGGARRERRGPGRRRAASGPGTVRPAQARGHRAGRGARLVRRQRRRHPPGRQGPRRAAGAARRRRQGRSLLRRRRHGGPVPGPVPGRPGRAVAARVRRGGADHAPGLLGRRTCPGWTGTACWSPTGRCWTGSAARTTSPTCCGRWSPSSARRTRT